MEHDVRAAGNRALHSSWSAISFLNANHMVWGWASLVYICLADLYVWGVASGAIHNLRII